MEGRRRSSGCLTPADCQAFLFLLPVETSPSAVSTQPGWKVSFSFLRPEKRFETDAGLIILREKISGQLNTLSRPKNMSFRVFNEFY